MRYWLEYIPFLIIAAIVRNLPRKTALAVGDALGSLGRYLQPKRVRIADDNLRHAFPEIPATERAQVVRSVFSDLGRGFVEMLRLDLYDRERDLERLFTIEGEEHLKAALAQQRGVILLGGHIGSWEAGNFVVPTRGYKFSVVAKPMKNPLVDAWFRRLRQAYGCTIIDSRKGARKIVKTLQENGCVGLLMDQHISRHEAVQVPFFGRPAWTTPIIAQIAAKYRAPVLPATCYRNRKDDTYRLVLGAPIQLDEASTPDAIRENTRLLTESIEAAIRVDLSQWFWIHRRWKHIETHDV